MKKYKAILLMALLVVCFSWLGSSVKADGNGEAEQTTGQETENWVAPPEMVGVLQNGQLFPTSPANYLKKERDYLAVEDIQDLAGLKQTLYEGMRNRQESIDVSQYNVEFDDLWVVFKQVLYGNGDLFYVYWTSGGSYAQDGKHAGSIRITYKEKYTAEDQAKFYQVCDEVIAAMPNGLNQEQKALYLHDYIVTHCQYDVPTLNDKSNGKYDAYNVMVEGSAVCQGYSLAYAYLCNRVGIKAYHVTSDENNHAWNLLVIDGVYYFVDCTWDDPVNSREEKYYPESFCKHTNFLRSRDGIRGTKHKYSQGDWTSEELGNVSEMAATSTKYDTYFWSDVETPIPRIGTTYAYIHSGDMQNVCLKEFNGPERVYAIPGKVRWYVWGGNSYYTSSFGAVTAVKDNFYFNTQDKVYRLTTNGELTEIYELSDEEKAQGYIYGLLAKGNAVECSIGKEYALAEPYVKKLITVVQEEVKDPAIMNSALATFEGKIGVAFRLELPDYVLNDQNAYVIFTKNGKQSKMLVSEATSEVINEKKLYRFTKYVMAKEYREKINLKLFDGEGNPVTIKGKSGTDYTESGVDYSLEQYVSTKKNSTDAKMASLAIALEDYCTAAQIYFNYNAAGLVASDRVKAVQNSDLDGFKGVFEGTMPAGLKKRSINVAFESDNSFMMLYTYEDGVDPDSFTYTMDTKAATLYHNEAEYYLLKSNVAAKNLDKVVTYTISKGDDTYVVKCSVLTYARSSVLNGTDARKDLGRALYLYNQAAKVYFGE